MPSQDDAHRSFPSGDTLGNLVFAATLTLEQQTSILEQVRDAHSEMRRRKFNTVSIQYCEECGTLGPGNPCRTAHLASKALEHPTHDGDTLVRAIVSILDRHCPWRPTGEEDIQCWECGWLYPCTTVQVAKITTFHAN